MTLPIRLELIPKPVKDIPCQKLMQEKPFTMSGFLRKKPTKSLFKSRKWPQRFVIISCGCIYIYSSEMSERYERGISLFGYDGVSKEEPAPCPWAFKITNNLEDREKSMCFAASSEEAMQNWLESFEREIFDANSAVARAVGRQLSDKDRQNIRHTFAGHTEVDNGSDYEETGEEIDIVYDTPDDNISESSGSSQSAVPVSRQPSLPERSAHSLETKPSQRPLPSPPQTPETKSNTWHPPKPPRNMPASQPKTLPKPAKRPEVKEPGDRTPSSNGVDYVDVVPDVALAESQQQQIVEEKSLPSPATKPKPQPPVPTKPKPGPASKQSGCDTTLNRSTSESSVPNSRNPVPVPLAKRSVPVPPMFSPQSRDLRSDEEDGYELQPTRTMPEGDCTALTTADFMKHHITKAAYCAQDISQCTLIMRSIEEEGAYMIRNSTDNKSKTLVVRTRVPTSHLVKFSINKSKNNEYGIANEATFSSLAKIIEYYSQNNLPNRTTKLTMPYTSCRTQAANESSAVH